MGFEPVNLGSVECPVLEPNGRFARHLTPSSGSELLRQVSAQVNGSSRGDRSRGRDSADDREVHRASLLDHSLRLVNVQEIRRLRLQWPADESR
jgi:hypothetical protein